MKLSPHTLLAVLICCAAAAPVAAQDASKPKADEPSKPAAEEPKAKPADKPAKPPADTPAAEQPAPATKKKDGTLPPVVVTGSLPARGVPQVDIRRVGARDVFGPEQVRETGARDMNDLVQNLPGASARPYNGGEAAAPSFSMRGLPDDGLTEYVNVQIDGVPASALPYGWTAFSFLPITTDRVYAIDYVRGAHTVRYSPNTVGGVLNLLTRPIPDQGGFSELRTTVGSFGYTSALAAAGYGTEEFGIMVEYCDRQGDGYRRHGEFDQQDLHLKTRFTLGEDHWIALSTGYMESAHQAPGGLTLAEFEADRWANARPDNAFDGYRAQGDLVWHIGLGGASWIEVFSYAAETHRELQAKRPHFGPATSHLRWDDESDVFAVGVRGGAEFDTGGIGHTVYGGARYHRDWIPSWKMYSEPVGGGPGTKTMDNEFVMDTFSAHVDDEIRLGEWFSLLLGVRMEWIPTATGEDQFATWEYDDEYFLLMPGGGLAFHPDERVAFFANYHEGFRTPQVWGFAYAVDSDDLVLERGRSAEAGARWKDVAGLSGSVVGFWTEYDDFGVFYTGFYENLGRIETLGVDVVLEWNAGALIPALDGLVLSGSFTGQDAKLKSGPNKDENVPYAWDTKATWRARYDLFGFQCSIGGVYMGGSYSDEANTGPENANGNLGWNKAWTVWDARIARRFELGKGSALEAAVGATNLFDEEWEVHSRGGFFGGGKVAGAPRQLYASLQLSFQW